MIRLRTGWIMGGMKYFGKRSGTYIFWSFTGGQWKHFWKFYLKYVCQYYSKTIWLGSAKCVTHLKGPRIFSAYLRGAWIFLTIKDNFTTPTPAPPCWQLPKTLNWVEIDTSDCLCASLKAELWGVLIYKIQLSQDLPVGTWLRWSAVSLVPV